MTKGEAEKLFEEIVASLKALEENKFSLCVFVGNWAMKAADISFVAIKQLDEIMDEWYVFVILSNGKEFNFT